ncbi:hypothetical protein [Viscerimonas tarda]
MKIILKAIVCVMAIMSVCNNILAQSMPMGYFDENTLSCYTKFQSTGFGASILFETNQTNTNMGDGDDYRQVGVFDIPLVGDLNGDGKPEIVVLSRSRRGLLGDYESDVCNRFLLIFDGQTGKLLVKKRLAIDSYTYAESYHGTPCTLLLMNVDNNDTRQIVVAYGTAGTTVNGKWAKRLVCYELNPQSGKGLPNVPSGKSDAGSATSELNGNYLKIKWVSDKRYDWSAASETGTAASASWSFTAGEAGSAFTDTGGYYYNNYQYFSTPLPQLVDFDGDGIPEIYVYNKIYDAKTGKLKLALEGLGPADSTSETGNYMTPLYSNIENRAFVGRDRTATSNRTGAGDTNVPFAFIYDLDKDGKYDIAAGGKVYYNITFPSDGTGGWNYNQPAGVYYAVRKGVKNDINGSNVGWPYSSSNYLGDGHTAVADINADGIPEVVVLTRTPGTTDSSSPLILTVYNPGFLQLDASGNIIPGTGVPSIIAQRTITPTGGATEGNHSYLFIGDLDGLEQNGKRFPEITFITRKLYEGTNSNNRIHHTNSANSRLHPNIRNNAAFISKLTKSGDNYYMNYDSSANGVMMSFTWDDDDSRINERMKVSFVSELNDRSINTGFTLFDFDNDGRQGICYRDESYLRIISVDAPYYVKNDDKPTTAGSLVRFREPVKSYTGFEYPVIADINGDFSADMVVTAASDIVFVNTGWLYAVEANTGAGIKFAPAPMVWNQFMYSPLKINEDLTVPSTVFDPLSPKLKFNKKFGSDAPFEHSIYNNTLTQVEQYSVFGELRTGGTPGNPADSIYIAYPVAKLPDAVVSAKLNGTTLAIKIKNLGTATLGRNNAYAVYNGNASAAHTVTSANHVAHGVIGRDIFPGDSVEINLTVTASMDYIIRVSDANYATGSYTGGQWRGSIYNECNWADNWAYASDFVLNSDVFVVKPYQQITFDVLANDELPLSCTNPIVTVTPPAAGAGVLSVSGANGQIVTYKAPATYPGGVVEIDYSVNCSATKQGKIYIYVFETTTNNFSTCVGTQMTVAAKVQPAGTTFIWRDGKDKIISTVGPGTFILRNDTTFKLRPQAPAPYDNVTFPDYTLTLRAISGSSGTPVLLRWKNGASNRDWHDPNNWVAVTGGVEGPAGLYIPSACTDVDVPSGITSGYPSLNKPGTAVHVSLKDRTMLGNTHHLTYDSASVEVNFKASERDRWVMYSAPLRRTYSGDFMLLNAAGKPIINPGPAVYMNAFQMKNPDDPSSVATAKMFTQPFGSADVPLGLGQTFNVWIDKDIDTSTPFRFPSRYDQYDYWVHGLWGGDAGDSTSVVLNRTNAVGAIVSNRFIVEDNGLDPDKNADQFELRPFSHQNLQYNGFELIMLPNPFVAYLDMAAFLTANTGLLTSEYKVWSGTDDAFVTYKAIPAAGSNGQGAWWWVADSSDPLDAPSGANRYVAPLQSFIGRIIPANNNVDARFMYQQSTMTTTENIGGASYTLRSAKEAEIPSGVMYIKAGIGNVSNTTVLVNYPGSSNAYTEDDALKLFYDNADSKAQVSVYTLSSDAMPMAINLSGDFNDVEIPVGIRTNITGEIQLNFSGIATFGRKAYLLDGDKEIDLSLNPTYKATLAGTGSSDFYEINNRFALKFAATGNSIDANRDNNKGLSIRTDKGKLYIDSEELIKSVDIMLASGLSVFRTEQESHSYTIDLGYDQIYILRIVRNNELITKKIITK